MQGYPFGKSYPLQDFKQGSNDLLNHKASPTGLLVGSKVQRSLADARHLEEAYDDDELYALKGDRRYAWIFPEALSFVYNKEREELAIDFYLPKGAYATTFLEEICKKSLKPKKL